MMLHEFTFSNALKVLAINRLTIKLRAFEQFVGINPTVFPGNFLRYANRKVLCTLNGTNKLARLIQAFHRARIKPSIPTTERDNRQGPFF